MGFRDWLLRQLGGVDTKALTMFSTVGLNRPLAPSTDVENLVNVYRGNPVVFSCVRAKADAITDPTIQVQGRDTDGDWQEIRGHPLKQLLSNPNPNMSAEQFMRSWIISREVAGVFYCEILRSRAGLPAALYPLDPQYVYPIYETQDNNRKVLVEWAYRDGAYEETIPLDYMLAMSDWNLGGSLSPLAVAIAAAASDDQHTDYIRGFWENAGVPAGVLTIKKSHPDNPPITDQQVMEMQDRWTSSLGGRNRGKIAVLEEAIYQRTGMNLGEIISTDLREVDEARICQALGVPPLIVYSYVGLQGATYSNLQEAWSQFWNTTMSSQLKDLRAWLSRSLLPEFVSQEQIRGEEVRLGWDLSEVGALQEHADAVAERTVKLWLAGMLPLNEARQALGLRDHPNPAYGLLNAYETQELAKALSGTAVINALDQGLEFDSGGGTALLSRQPRGGIDGRFNDIEWGVSSLSERVTNLAVAKNGRSVFSPNGNGDHDD